MKLPWYKLRIKELLEKDIDKFNFDKYWDKSLKLVSKNLGKNEFENEFNNISISMGVFERVRQTTQLWSDERTINAVNLSILFNSLYLCIVYPRQGILKKIKKNFDSMSKEYKIFDFFTGSNSITRHIRNALAHGTFLIKNNSIEFNDRKYKGEYNFLELELIVLILLDLVMSFYEQNYLKIDHNIL